MQRVVADLDYLCCESGLRPRVVLLHGIGEPLLRAGAAALTARIPPSHPTPSLQCGWSVHGAQAHGADEQLCPGSAPLSLIGASAKARSSNFSLTFYQLFTSPGLCFSLLHRAGGAQHSGAAGSPLPPQTLQTLGCGKEGGRDLSGGERQECSVGAACSAAGEAARGSWSCGFSPIPAPLPPSLLLSGDAFVSHELNVCHQLLDNLPYQPKFPFRLLTTMSVSAAFHPRCCTSAAFTSIAEQLDFGWV